MAPRYDPLKIDPSKETDRIVSLIYDTTLQHFHKNGGVIGLSGGVDSATVLALTVRALGADRVKALALPDCDSESQSEILARKTADLFGVTLFQENLTDSLSVLSCYKDRDAAITEIFPDYNPKIHKAKIVLPNKLLETGSLNVFWLVLVDQNNNERRKMLTKSTYLNIVAASNMKQRLRMLRLYKHAEQSNYAVIGTANKNEHDQGFFVKYGDGGADIQPIQHLFKSQVYQLARYLGVPEEILSRPPTTDTYSASCTQEEFYFRLPFELLDCIWYGLENKVPAIELADLTGLGANQIDNAYKDIAQKIRTTEYLRTQPVTLGKKIP